MKKAMPKRATLGKESTFLNSLKSKNRNRSVFRPSRRKKEEFPNSSKVGAGHHYVRRNLSQLTVHRRNHRTELMVAINTKL